VASRSVGHHMVPSADLDIGGCTGTYEDSRTSRCARSPRAFQRVGEAKDLEHRTRRIHDIFTCDGTGR